MVQTAEGLPISHRVWGGNVAETSTLASVIAEVTRNYPVHLNQPLEYIVAVPGRRYVEFVDVLAGVPPANLHEMFCRSC